MLRIPPSTLLVGVCSLAGVRRCRSLALTHERRVIRRATGSLDLGADATEDQRPSALLYTHVPDALGDAACSSLLALSSALARADVSIAACPAVEPAQLLRAEAHPRKTAEDDELYPTWETSAVVEIETNGSPSRTILIQCDRWVDVMFALAVADRANASTDVVANTSLVTCARPPEGTSPSCECAKPWDGAPVSESAPRIGENATPEDGDPTCLVTLGPDDQLPLDFGDVVINSLRDD